MNKLILILFTLLLGACATAYQKEGLTGGFSETQLSENTWKVHFEGNGYTRTERAEDYALLRASELTLKNGFSYFLLADSKSSTDEQVYKTPTTSNTQAYVQSNGYGYATTTQNGGNLIFISKPSATNIVVMFKEKPETKGLIFDAAFLCRSLGAKYEVNCNASN